MALSIITDEATHKLMYPQRPPFSSSRIGLLGQKEIEPQERQRIDEGGFCQLSCLGDVTEALAGFLAGNREPIVYVHVDLDVLHPSDYFNPKCAIRQGMTVCELGEVVREITSQAKVVGMTIAENAETDERIVRHLVDTLTASLSWA